MKKNQRKAATLLIATTLLSSPTLADSDEWGNRSYMRSSSEYNQYREECGSCHIASPPSLLGKISWGNMMRSLDNHFGDNAELAPQEQKELSAYLQQYGSSDRWYQFWRKGDSEIPLRITESRPFVKEHDEIPRRFLDNPKIGSLSNCGSCHLNAADGSFNEHDVRIPGVGRWDD